MRPKPYGGMFALTYAFIATTAATLYAAYLALKYAIGF